MHYSKSTKGFYSNEIHGHSMITIVDPAWLCPEIEVPDPAFDPSQHPEGTPVPLVKIKDPNAVPATIEVPNPDCKIPADAVEVPDDVYRALLDAQSMGKVIEPDTNGFPVAVDHVPTAAEIAAIARAERDTLLAAADIAINKAEDAGQDSTALRKYRQKLRDWPSTKGFPDLTTLPVMP